MSRPPTRDPAPVPEYPFRFTCQRSGNCCAVPGGVVRVGDADIAAIASHLALTEAACRSRFVAPGGDRLVDGPSHACVFLLDGAETSCAIYPVRPERCRTWPFWPELLADPEVLRRAAARCPGIQLDPELAEG